MARGFEAAYLELWRSGELKRRAEEAYARLEACDICARECGVNRRQSAEGAGCHTADRAVVASYGPHFGEEAPRVGRGGSGTLFFTWCNLRCQFCQNYDISQSGHGREVRGLISARPIPMIDLLPKNRTLTARSRPLHRRKSRLTATTRRSPSSADYPEDMRCRVIWPLIAAG